MWDMIKTLLRKIHGCKQITKQEKNENKRIKPKKLKNTRSAMQETQVWSLGWEDSLRRKWQPTPVFLPGKSHGRQSLVGYCAWGRKELDMTDQLHFTSLIIPRGFFFPSFCGGKYIGKNVTQINACSTQSWTKGESTNITNVYGHT